MNEQHKAITIVTILLIFLAGSLVWQGSKQHAKTLAIAIKSSEEELKSAIITLESYSFKPYRQRIKNLLQSTPEISEAFARHDRAALYQLCLPRYQAMQRENKFFTIMHFHLPDGTTFLRVHIPEFYGDNLTEARPIITAVNRQNKPLSGFEIGRSGAFFRVVEPIFYKGVYVGALEFGILAHQVIDHLMSRDKLILTTYFDKDLWSKTSLFDQSQVRLLDNLALITHGDSIYKKLPQDMELSRTSWEAKIADRTYLIQTRPIFKNYAGQSIGGILALQDISTYVESKRAFLGKNLLFSGIMVAVCLAVVFFYFDRIIGALLKENKERRKTEKALRSSESRFRLLVQDLPNIAVQGYNRERHVTLWNKGSEQLYGYTEQEALGKKLEDLIIPAAMREEIITAMNGWFDLGIAMPAKEITLRHKNGNPVPIFSSHALVYQTEGEPNIYCVDVSLKDLKEAQNKHNAMEQQLVRAQKMEAIGLMAGGVAHDLNNILSGLVSYPELLLMQLPEDSPMRKPITTILESGGRAAAVVADLLTVARGVAKTTEIVSPNDFVSSYQKTPEFNELCRRHPLIEINLELAEGMQNISCSSVHIMKVLTNLMNNAAEAIGEEGTITISTRMETVQDFFAMEHTLDPGPYCLITITDDGPGISPEDLSHIFEPFFTKKIMGRSGTGLGLAVVWNTMRDHGGVVVAKSSQQGSSFTLYFPACEEKPNQQVKEGNLDDLQGSGEKILVVDDEKVQRLIAERVLSSLGYEPYSVSSGEEALDFLRENKVDLVVLDMIMDPGMNGKETYAAILELHPEQKAIIASGFSQSDDVRDTLAMGAGCYVKKPYTMAQLGDAVKRELSRKTSG